MTRSGTGGLRFHKLEIIVVLKSSQGYQCFHCDLLTHLTHSVVVHNEEQPRIQ
jgi:hypothetical protein